MGYLFLIEEGRMDTRFEEGVGYPLRVFSYKITTFFYIEAVRW